MKLIKNGNWWLKLLALGLAILVYYTLKNDTVTTLRNDGKTEQH